MDVCVVWTVWTVWGCTAVSTGRPSRSGPRCSRQPCTLLQGSDGQRRCECVEAWRVLMVKSEVCGSVRDISWQQAA
eukprot:364466-Chlamydomonas_euryale.AAC.4